MKAMNRSLPAERRCRICRQVLPITEFRWEHKSKNIRKGACGPCENARMRADRLVNGDQRRKQGRESYARRADRVYRNGLARRYSLSPAGVEKVVSAPGCLICSEKPEDRKLVVDHCHVGEIARGVLCPNCNAGLGQFKDSPQLLRLAAAYLEQPSDMFFGAGDRA